MDAYERTLEKKQRQEKKDSCAQGGGGYMRRNGAESKFGGPTRFSMETRVEQTGYREGRRNDGCCLILVPHMGALRDTFH